MSETLNHLFTTIPDMLRVESEEIVLLCNTEVDVCVAGSDHCVCVCVCGMKCQGKRGLLNQFGALRLNLLSH